MTRNSIKQKSVFRKYILNKLLDYNGILEQLVIHPGVICGNIVQCQMWLIKELTLDFDMHYTLYNLGMRMSPFYSGR